LSYIENVEIVALCDQYGDKVDKCLKILEERGLPAAAGYSGSKEVWKELCGRPDIDLVYICTPWEWHTPMSVFAMEAGKHVACEVPAATTTEECWQLVECSERTQKHCMQLENCCYDFFELLTLNMARQGYFGEIIHGEGAYIHNLMELNFDKDYYAEMWRLKENFKNGNLYPTHGLGPVAWYMNIHQGDRFTRLVSMSSLPAALAEYRDANLPSEDPKRGEIYRCGDMNVSLLQTALGRTVVLQHDVVTPRPYSRINLIQGSQGAFCDYPPRIFVNGQKEHEWKSLDHLKADYEHPLWKKYGETALKLGGHGGMDFIMNSRLIQTIRRGQPPDMDVYDAAAWSAPGPLSEISVAENSMPLPFPDFTRGRWKAEGAASKSRISKAFAD